MQLKRSLLSAYQEQTRDWFSWYNRFKEDWEDVNNDGRLTGRPSKLTTDENIQAVKKMILDNRWITIEEFADDVVKTFSSCQAIFTDIWTWNMRQRRLFQNC